MVHLLNAQGILLVSILGGMKSTDAFGHNVGMTRVKGYLVFILAFTAITNSVVSSSAYSFLQCSVINYEQRFVGSTLYLFARLITG